MNIADALGIAFRTGSGRKRAEGEVDHTEEVGWGYGVAGVVVLALVQAGMLIVSGGDLGPEIQRDLALVAYAALAAPLILFAIGAALTHTMARLPAAFLYLGLVLAGLQLLSAVAANFGSSTSGFLIGLLGAIGFLAARGFLKLGNGGAVLMGILVVIAFIGAGMLLFVLPAGRLLT